MYDHLSPLARELIAEARSGIGPEGPVDHHVHLAGSGTGITGALSGTPSDGIWLHPDYRSWLHPVRSLEAAILLRACGITNPEGADAQYLERLLSLVRSSGVGGQYMLCALDWRYEKPPHNREPNKDKTDLFVDNAYVLEAVAWLNESASGCARFIPVVSVHPYRPDAADVLAMLSERGARHVKWLPPCQNIDPGDPIILPYYRVLRQLGFTLLSHTGDEHTLRVADNDQELANPLRLAAALEEGVTVVMLHAGRDGIERILGPDGERRSYAERFLQMMARYPSNLYGEISAIPYLGTHAILERLLDDPSIVRRLVNGSDYPAPAIPGIDPTGRLLHAGYLSDAADDGPRAANERRRALKEIRRFNPLLFDFVLKRTLRINGRKMPVSVFGCLNDGVREGIAEL